MTTLAVQTAMMLLNSGGPRAQALDLPGRPRFSARLGRRLSRPRTAPQSGGNRTAPGSSRPATARGHAVLSRLGPCRGRRAQPAGGDALVRSRRGDAPARPGLQPISNTSYSTCRAPGSPGPTACCSARTSLFIVSETTVPGLRHAKQLVAAIKERLGDGPNPQVIVNRFEQTHVRFRPAPRRSRADAGRRLRQPRSPTTTLWCARRSIAACRSMRSSPATRSRRSSRSWCWTTPAAKTAAGRGQGRCRIDEADSSAPPPKRGLKPWPAVLQSDALPHRNCR